MLGVFYNICDLIHPCLTPYYIQKLIKLTKSGHDEVNKAFQPRWHRLYIILCVRTWPIRHAMAQNKMRICDRLNIWKDKRREMRMRSLVEGMR